MNIATADGLLESLMQRSQAKLQECFIDVMDASAVQRVAKPVPGLLGGRAHLPPVQQNDVLIASQVEREAVMMKIRRAAKILET